jgi:hypothetical protein
MNISNTKDPARLYCFWFIKRLFPSLHHLVYYRYQQSPETMKDSWKKMIVKGSLHNFNYPLGIVESCPRKNLFDLDGFRINDYVPRNECVLQFDLLCKDSVLAIDCFAGVLFQSGEHERLEQLIRYSKSGAAYSELTFTLESLENSDLWIRLLILPEYISKDSERVLKEYCDRCGIVIADLPFSSQDIRENINRLTQRKVCDFAVCARIVRAFAEVEFNNCPVFFNDKAGLIEYFVANPDMLTRYEFKMFLQWLDAENRNYCSLQ